jgi:hypothetical protein
MSVQQLVPTAEIGCLVTAARSSVTAAAAVPTDALDIDDLVTSIETAAALESQVAALRLRLVQEADSRRLAASLGATDTASWAARLTGSTAAVMAGGLRLARLLEERYDATREAFAEGAINEAQTRVIVEAAERLPAEVTEEERRLAEAGLVVKAVNGMDARRLRQAARRMLDQVSVELADRHEAGLLLEEQRHAETETWLNLDDNGDGTFSGRFRIPELHGHLLKAALERLSAPQRLARNRAGNLVHDDTLPGGGPTLPWPERMGLGFTELIEHLPTEASGGFSRVSAGVVVHISLQHLLDQVGSGRLDTGVHVSPGEVRRLACNAGIIPAVLGSRSEPLDLGFEARLHNTAMRRALSIQHDTCGAEGCERPFAWCDVHHLHPWSQGGRTSLENGIPLCGFHHQRAHDERFTLRQLPSGEVRFHRRR